MIRPGLIWLPIAAFTAFVGVATWSTARLDDVQNSTSRLTEAFLRVERAVGYVGFIHHFKNAVLRPAETRYLELAEAELAQAEGALADLEATMDGLGLDVNVGRFRDTLAAYGAMLPVIEEMGRAGASPQEIDVRVRIPDEAAAFVLAELEATARSQIDRRNATQKRFLLLLIVGAGGLTIVMAGLTIETTWRRQKSVRRLTSVLDRIETTVSVVGPDGRMDFYNKAFEDEMARRGVTLGTKVAAQDLAATLAPQLCHSDLAAEVLGEQNPAHAVRDVAYRDGTVFESQIYVLPDGARLFVRRNVTEQRQEEARAERQQRQLMEELAASNRELENFAHAASHDLQEPLRGIAINAGFLEREPLTEKGQQRVKRMVALCAREQAMIDALLNLARLRDTDGDGAIAHPAETILLIREDMAGTLEKQNGKLLLETRLPPVRMREARVHSLFLNLIENGFKYNTSETPVVAAGFRESVTVAGEELANVFYVRDNGIGIAPEHQDGIWKMFSRVDNSDKAPPGTGVGLAFVARIISAYGGAIRLVSEPGRGSTFYMTLPLADGPAASQETAAEPTGSGDADE